MYETPVDVVDNRDSESSNPVLVEKRQDIKVFNNPGYRSQASVKFSDCKDDGSERERRTMNHYETADPVSIYETIDDDLYEKVREEKVKEHEAGARESTRTEDTNQANKKRKKSRTNPVYDVGVDNDSLNPVVNFAVTSPSRKAKKDGNFTSSDYEDNDLDDSLSSQILRTFQAQNKSDHSYENVGMVNPLALREDEPQIGELGERDSRPAIQMKNELYPLEHQESFEANPDGGELSSC